MVARRTLRTLLGGWRLSSLVEPVVLATSELVTNAFRHGTPPIRLTVRRSANRVTVGVQDSSPNVPATVRADPDDEGGRGMVIIQRVASETGTRPEEAGKVVWAGFDVTGHHDPEVETAD